MIINKTKLLEQNTGDFFIQIEENYYKGKKGDAIIVKKENLQSLIKLKSFEEIPYLPNELLQKYLPEKYKNELFLLDSKDLARYDHTILSNQIKSDRFVADVVKLFDDDLTELVFAGSKKIEIKDYIIFYLQND